MENNDIIKALELCKSDERGQCLNKCPYYNYSANCSREMISDALDLIIRQQKELEAKHAHILCLKTEIERLEKIIGKFPKVNMQDCNFVRDKAITEYHEEVKKRCIEGGIYPVIVKKIMEDVRREMTGEQQ